MASYSTEQYLHYRITLFDKPTSFIRRLFIHRPTKGAISRDIDWQAIHRKPSVYSP